MQRFIKIDGKVRTDVTYPTGFMGEWAADDCGGSDQRKRARLKLTCLMAGEQMFSKTHLTYFTRWM